MTRTVELLVSSLLVVLLIVLGVVTMPAADAHPQFDAGRTAQLSIHKTASSTTRRRSLLRVWCLASKKSMELT